MFGARDKLFQSIIQPFLKIPNILPLFYKEHKDREEEDKARAFFKKELQLSLSPFMVLTICCYHL